MKLLRSCEYNMDAACVELRYSDGSTLALDCIEIENLYGNSPLAYADLILTGDVEAYLRTVAQERYLD